MVTSADPMDAILHSPAFALTARSNTMPPTVKPLVATMRSGLRRSSSVIAAALSSVECGPLASRVAAGAHWPSGSMTTSLPQMPAASDA
eukprot:7959314-Pyramimonas_sp.AAC.1